MPLASTEPPWAAELASASPVAPRRRRRRGWLHWNSRMNANSHQMEGDLTAAVCRNAMPAMPTTDESWLVRCATRASKPNDEMEQRHHRGNAMLPLTGVKVVEIANNVAGPYAGYILAALGADVVKVERP